MEIISPFLELGRKCLIWLALRRKQSSHIESGRDGAGELPHIFRRGCFGRPPTWDVLLLPQPELRQDVHTDCRTGTAIPRISYPKRSTVCLSHFPKAPILALAQTQCIYKKVCYGCWYLQTSFLLGHMKDSAGC